VATMKEGPVSEVPLRERLEQAAVETQRMAAACSPPRLGAARVGSAAAAGTNQACKPAAVQPTQARGGSWSGSAAVRRASDRATALD
jgi:hypothetical protein